MNHNRKTSPQYSNRRNLLAGTAEGILAMPWAFLSLPSNFVFAALLTQVYRVDAATYGLIASLPAWGNAAQIFIIPWLTRFLSPKELALGMGWLNIGLWTMLAVMLQYLPAGSAQVSQVFIIFFLLASLSLAFTSVGWTSWVKDWVPTRVRGRYFGARNRWLNLSTVTYLLFAMLLFELEKNALWPYQMLIVAAVIMRYGGLIWQYGIRTPTEHFELPRSSWAAGLRDSLRSKELVIFIIFSAWVSFWIGFAGPFLPVFSFEELGLEPGTFSILVILATISGIFGWWFWGKQVDRHGCVPILFIGLLLWEIPSYVWVFITPSTTWMLYPLWTVGGFFAVAYMAASFNLLLKLVPHGSRVIGVSLHLAVTSVAGAIAPVLAGILLTHFIEADAGLTAYRSGFALKSTAVLLGLFMLRWAHEPKRSPNLSLPGAFLTLRQLLVTQGGSFLDSLTSQKVQHTKYKNKRRRNSRS